MGKKLTSLLAALSFAVVAGCVVTPTQPVYVYREPPPPRAEYPGYPPVSGYIWISGYWVWGGSGYDWFPGRWEAPRPGYRWVAPRWEHAGDRWYQHEGRWEHDYSAPRPSTPPPAAPRYEPQRVEPMPRRDVERDHAAPPRYEQREPQRPPNVQPSAPRPPEPQPRIERREPQAQPQQQFQAPRKEAPRSQERKDDNRGKGKPDPRRDPRDER